MLNININHYHFHYKIAMEIISEKYIYLYFIIFLNNDYSWKFIHLKTYDFYLSMLTLVEFCYIYNIYIMCFIYLCYEKYFN